MKTISRTVLAVLCTAALGVVASAAEAASTPEHGTAAAHFNGGRTLSLAMSGQSLVYGYSSGSVAFQGQVPCPPFAGGGNVTVSSSEGITPASAHWNGNDVAAFATSARMLADSGWAPNACASLHWTVTANVNVSNP